MREARRLAASDELLLYEIDGHIRALLKGGGNRVGMNVLFLPTGPLQELSLDEGWGDEFCALADRFDVAVRAYGHYCAVCSKLAGTLVVRGALTGFFLVDPEADRARTLPDPRTERWSA